MEVVPWLILVAHSCDKYSQQQHQNTDLQNTDPVASVFVATRCLAFSSVSFFFKAEANSNFSFAVGVAKW